MKPSKALFALAALALATSVQAAAAFEPTTSLYQNIDNISSIQNAASQHIPAWKKRCFGQPRPPQHCHVSN